MMRLGYAVAISALLSHSSVSIAAETSALERVKACVTHSDEAQRLACYDAALGVGSDTVGSDTVGSDTVGSDTAGSGGVNGANPPVPPNAPVSQLPSPTTDESTATERFGFHGDVAREKVDREAAAAPKLKILQARIAAIEWLPLGEFVLTLDNGQVWRQKAQQSIGPLHAGDQVTIRAGALGSFRLSGSSNRSTLVQRVK